ncbi:MULTISPECIES: HEAT repeat domain-containing protein [unclassified Tolypothrix]|uniref:HEAT repeat domain-containing protein n=1 Tax=unclassified Tolypothrix TaxID=2649714 RepID=UPI0005EABB1E|nr:MULTISPECIES: HEAT repeat domain-containing protein [unclassified Tolypothrix]BAY88626.1 HEAT repeat-containing PBS lyase [Microchaete diplosiphon NIES-3275]EKF00295.1 PBS lyase HEAT protein [Tolypothrix sp. PCC 7601]MBE9086535.1 HEAT repeat domain-containing protein [Tolypothrix sp. LEGE 11397]UYD29297.1 HEAT repeat domain-containing protein [Tolypothrix sp. PCC 7712]UYD34794.1 HEAT repeat domain-containing protein [Tolypothrix sp. PCC 7601]
MDNINQLLVQAQAAHDAADWSLLIQYLQQLILKQESTHPEILENQELLLDLTISILEMGDFQQRWEIAKIFQHLGKLAIPRLVKILEDEDADEEVRWYAVRILGELEHPEAIAPLVQLLKTSDSQELKEMAANALGKMDRLASAALTELLLAEDTRLLAVRSLSYIRSTETIQPLLSVVEDPQPAVRTAAIEALSSFHNELIPPVLVKALDDFAASVRHAAVQGLGFRPELCETLDLVTKLQPRLYDLNENVACTAAITLARMGSDHAAQCLFAALISPSISIKLQLEIICALSWLGTSASLAYLQQAFNQSTSETVWQEIVTVLGRVQQPELIPIATEILLAILQSNHPATELANIKNAIALSLGQLGCIQAIEPLILLLADAEPSVRLHTIAALKNLSPEIAHQQLQKLANNTSLTPDLQQGVAIALAEWGR